LRWVRGGSDSPARSPKGCWPQAIPGALLPTPLRSEPSGSQQLSHSLAASRILAASAGGGDVAAAYLDLL